MTRPVPRPPVPEEVALAPSPRLAILVALTGADAVVDASCSLLLGADPADPLLPHLSWWGGASEVALSASGLDLAYWPRVWGARGLLHVYRSRGAAAVLVGLRDPSWRVREMCVKVVRAHEIGAAAGELARLCSDEVTRVRVAAVRGLAVVGEAEEAVVLRRLVDDVEPEVARSAEKSLRDMGIRLDRDV